MFVVMFNVLSDMMMCVLFAALTTLNSSQIENDTRIILASSRFSSLHSRSSPGLTKLNLWAEELSPSLFYTTHHTSSILAPEGQDIGSEFCLEIEKRQKSKN